MKKLTHREIDIMTEIWMRYYVNTHHQLCGLCGNTGRVNTLQKAVSAAGVECGLLTFCICPNGLHMRKIYERETKQ